MGNKGCLVLVLLVGTVLLISSLIPPITPTSKVGECRRSMTLIRHILVSDNIAIGGDTFLVKLQKCPTRDLVASATQMVNYCTEYSRQIGKEIFLFGNTTNGFSILDVWGSPYNVDFSTNVPMFIKNEALQDYTVGPFIIWSSGPNCIDERGEGDDVFEHHVTK